MQLVAACVPDVHGVGNLRRAGAIRHTRVVLTVRGRFGHPGATLPTVE